MLNIGIEIPTIPMKIKYAQKTGTTPKATVHTAIMSVASVIVCILFLKPPQDAMIIPPAIMPNAKAISIAVSRHTALPKVLAT